MTFLHWQPSVPLAWTMVFFSSFFNVAALNFMKMAAKSDSLSAKLNWMISTGGIYLCVPILVYFSQRTLPVGQSLAVWLGLITLGIFFSGGIFHGEMLTWKMSFYLTLIVIGCLGLATS